MCQKGCSCCCCCQCRAEEDEVVEPFLKYIITIFNFIFMVIGIVYVIIGSWLLYERDRLQSENSNFEGVFNTTRDLGIAFIFMGIPTILFTLFGIIATLRENITVLKIYMAFLIVVLILGLLIGVIFLIFSGKIKDYIQQNLQQKYIVSYFDDPDYKSILDTLQLKFSCCGITGYTDWSNNVYFNCNTTNSAYRCLVPYSCCIGATSDTNKFCSGDILSPNPTSVGNINTEGCSTALLELKNEAIYALCGILVGMTIILVIGIVLVHLLIKDILEDIKGFNTEHNKKRDNFDIPIIKE